MFGGIFRKKDSENNEEAVKSENSKDLQGKSSHDKDSKPAGAGSHDNLVKPTSSVSHDMESRELTAKKEDFSEWYHQVIRVADLIDQRYPFQGFLVYKPYGFGVLKKCFDVLEKLLAETGHKQCYFPAVIPEVLLKREEHHIQGFSDQVFWIMRAGKRDLAEHAALRPTSETAMYEMLSLWIRSWRDLPVKIHQSTSVYRYETKHTRPLIRDREILWNEAHTSHATAEEAAKQIEEGMWVYSEVFKAACIPVIFLNVTDVFAGAVSATEPYTIFPDGRGLEMGSVNNLGQRFSRAFNIKFKKEDGTEDFAYQTCYGISERMLAAVVAVHGDDKGLAIPPKIAPIQVVIVPIIFQGKKEDVLEKAKKIKAQLDKEGVRVHLDDREQSVGSKFYDWEIRGVPLRIEIGPRDIEKSQITIVRRDNSEKSVIGEKNSVEFLKTLLENVQTDMLNRAERYHKGRIGFATNIDEIKELFMQKKTARIAWCGSVNCAAKIEQEVDASFIGYEEGLPEEKAKETCMICSKHGKHLGYVGKTY